MIDNRAKIVCLAAGLIAMCLSGAPAKADRDITADNALSVPKDGILDDGMAGWVWTGMSPIADDLLHGGTAHAGGPESSATLAFHGTSIEVFTVTGPSVAVNGHPHKPGTMKVSVDGKEQGTFSPKRASVDYDVSAVRVSGLSDSNHVLEITCENGWFAVDYVKIASGVSVGATGADGKIALLDNVDFSRGFMPDADLQLNGVGHIMNNALVLTTGQFNQAGSAFTTRQVSTRKFKTKFQMQFFKSEADGIVFCIQGISPQAIGGTGDNIGYGGIQKSMAVKFDLYDNSGEGTASTGLYFNGFEPTSPFIDLTHSAISFRGGHPIDVDIDYDGRVLNVTETDTVSQGKMSQSYPLDLPKMIGPSGFVGFTASTGGSVGTQVVRSWTFKTTP